jgi:hypothetical protein
VHARVLRARDARVRRAWRVTRVVLPRLRVAARDLRGEREAAQAAVVAEVVLRDALRVRWQAQPRQQRHVWPCVTTAPRAHKAHTHHACQRTPRSAVQAVQQARACVPLQHAAKGGASARTWR